MLLGFGARAQEVQLSESDLKAAFLFQFAKFVDWPAGAFAGEDSPIEIGILGDDDFAAALQALLQGKKAHGRSFQVARVSTQAQARKCHMLFFRESETRKLGPMLDGLRQLPILTVGESADFIAQGGMMNFFIDDKQLRFEIGPSPVQAARLTVSSQLMRLAKIRKGGAK
jgi:hypothetical protein